MVTDQTAKLEMIQSKNKRLLNNDICIVCSCSMHYNSCYILPCGHASHRSCMLNFAYTGCANQGDVVKCPSCQITLPPHVTNDIFTTLSMQKNIFDNVLAAADIPLP